MKIRIKAIHAVAAWRWDLPEDSDDTCGICQNEFDATCSTCKFPGDDCPLQTGQCKHTFHSHCVEKWLNQPQTDGKCPMCRQTFESRDTSTRYWSVHVAPTPQQGPGTQIPPPLPPQLVQQTPVARQTQPAIEGPVTEMNSPPEAAELSESSDDRDVSEEVEEAESVDEDSDDEVENTNSMDMS